MYFAIHFLHTYAYREYPLSLSLSIFLCPTLFLLSLWTVPWNVLMKLRNISYCLCGAWCVFALKFHYLLNRSEDEMKRNGKRAKKYTHTQTHKSYNICSEFVITLTALGKYIYQRIVRKHLVLISTKIYIFASTILRSWKLWIVHQKHRPKCEPRQKSDRENGSEQNYG